MSVVWMPGPGCTANDLSPLPIAPYFSLCLCHTDCMLHRHSLSCVQPMLQLCLYLQHTHLVEYTVQPDLTLHRGHSQCLLQNHRLALFLQAARPGRAAGLTL